MAAETLTCPMCGAPASSEATSCEHCGARLATVACPSCFGMIFQGAKFCSHCGARASRVDEDPQARHLCPRCRTDLRPVALGNTTVEECPGCDGIWVDRLVLQQLCADREKQGAVLGMASPLPETEQPVEKVRYVPCPLCGKLMNRVNFAHCSHVVVDVCREHGTWFDKDELRRIVEFLRAGGMEAARQMEIAEIEEQRRKLNEARLANARTPGSIDYSDRGVGVGAAGALLRFFLG